jgi:hypothetical protein
MNNNNNNNNHNNNHNNESIIRIKNNEELAQEKYINKMHEIVKVNKSKNKINLKKKIVLN